MDTFERLRPRRRPDVDVHEVRYEMVLYDPECGTGYSLNLSARAVWELCDGSRTVRQICDELAEVVDREPEALRSDVWSAVREFAARDLLQLENGTDE